MSSRIEKIRLACEKLNNSLNVVSEPMQTVEYSSDLSGQVAAVAVLDYSEAGVETSSNRNQLKQTTYKHVACNEKILDYVEDSDDSVKDPNFETPNHTSDEENGPSELSRKQLTRWKKSRPDMWEKNVSKKRRSESLDYKINKKSRPAKQPQPVNCHDKCRYKCHEKFSDEERKSICELYWKLTGFTRQKDFLLCNITSKSPERRRARSGNKPARANSKQYYFEKNKNKMRICQNFFLKTLNIFNVVLNAFSHKGPAGTYIGEDRRGKSEPGNKTPANIVADIKTHIESFPSLESHYTRKSTQRQYLDSKLSISKMNALYKEKCDSEAKEAASFITYKRIFGKNYNKSFLKPKKDLCQLCEKYKHTTADQQQIDEIYKNHMKRKEDCYGEKRDKERAIPEETFLSVTFDLQSVLQIPCSNVSPMYYARKMCVYNFTIYESAPPNHAFCFCWSELNGKRRSSEIGTCLFQYLSNLPPHVKEVSLSSDTCGGQNRNQHVAALLLYLVQISPHLETIDHKFLESGHSYMEADSMHSAIERAKKYVPVYTMKDWLNIFHIARSSRNRNKMGGPYNVKELHFQDFWDLKSLSDLLIKNKSKDTDGQTVNWLRIKSLRYSKRYPHIIQHKYEHSSDYKAINIFGKGGPSALPKQIMTKLYNKMLPISTKKKADLIKLCKSGAIPIEFHGWYKSLPTDKNIQELTLEPFVEDSDMDFDSSDDEPLIKLVQKK